MTLNLMIALLFYISLWPLYALGEKNHFARG